MPLLAGSSFGETPGADQNKNVVRRVTTSDIPSVSPDTPVLSRRFEQCGDSLVLPFMQTLGMDHMGMHRIDGADGIQLWYAPVPS